MKILMLVNWKVNSDKQLKAQVQAPDYYAKGEAYWFFRFFKSTPEVDVIDISSFQWLEKFEKDKLRFYVFQALKAIPRINDYDLVISHGMQSAVVLCLWRRLLHGNVKHVVFDIGSFNSASERGLALKLMQFASKSIDALIYHTPSQLEYYNRFYPWIVSKSRYIRFGTDLDFFDTTEVSERNNRENYIVCVGYAKRDWNTLIEAYCKLNTTVKLRLIGKKDERYVEIENVEQIERVSINELKCEIKNSLFAVLPLESFNYSYGQMTLLQQMALEKAVVCARVPSLVDYVDDGETGLFYEPLNAYDLSEKMKMLISDAHLREYIGKNARRYLEEKCNERIMATEIEDTLTMLLKA